MKRPDKQSLSGRLYEVRRSSKVTSQKEGESGVLWTGYARPQHPTPQFQQITDLIDKGATLVKDKVLTEI